MKQVRITGLKTGINKILTGNILPIIGIECDIQSKLIISSGYDNLSGSYELVLWDASNSISTINYL
jgi:hypothetical protein